MSDWTVIGSTSEFADGQLARRSVADVDICVVRLGDVFHCFEDLCSHMDVPLSKGVLINGELMCKAHGARFDLATGKPLCMPATSPILRFECKVDHDKLLADLDN